MNAWLPQASYPCGNFSDTSCLKLLTRTATKGSIGHAFTVCIGTENQNQMSFCPFAPGEVSVLAELTLGHLRYRLTDVPPSQTPRLTPSSERIAAASQPAASSCTASHAHNAQTQTLGRQRAGRSTPGNKGTDKRPQSPVNCIRKNGLKYRIHWGRDPRNVGPGSPLYWLQPSRKCLFHREFGHQKSHRSNKGFSFPRRFCRTGTPGGRGVSAE